MKVLTLVSVALALFMAQGFMEKEKIARFEFPVLVILATCGMLIMISANDMIALYMGLELQSLALYVVAAINRESGRSTEAGLKYFVLGALSSGMLLYGISLIYGFTGTVNFTDLALLAPQTEGANQLGLILAWYLCWQALRSRFRQCRFICGHPMSMKARQHRSPHFLLLPQSWRRWLCFCAR